MLVNEGRDAIWVNVNQTSFCKGKIIYRGARKKSFLRMEITD